MITMLLARAVLSSLRSTSICATSIPQSTSYTAVVLSTNCNNRSRQSCLALPGSSNSSCTRRTYMSSSRLCMAAVSGNEMLAQFSGTAKGQNVGLAMQSLVESNAVCFDVDSTVITEEGIDVLAAHLGKGKQVADLTAAAMEGGMKFQDALQQRLDLLQPSRQQIQECLKQHPFEFSPSVVAFVRKLQELNKHVYLVSGGFRIMIEPVAERLGIPCSNIFANTIVFDDESGAYTGFDPTEPTSRDMGKPKAVQAIIDKGNYETVVMIGDGATDAQAKPPAAAFIGFGGIAVRDKVRATADWFVTDFADCLAILEKYDGRAR